MRKSADRPLVSIVIPVRNEETALRRLLNTFKRQTYKNFEVIVVDGHSTDETVRIAKKYGARVIEEHGAYRSPANARNIGVEESVGEIIGIMDSDNEVEPNFVKSTVDAYLKDKNRFFGTKYTIDICDDSFLSRVRAAHISATESNVTPLPVFMLAKHRRALGKWDPALGYAEDRVYMKQVENYLAAHHNLRMVQVKSTIHLHVTHNLSELLSQQIWYGRTIPFYLCKTKKLREYRTLLRAGYVLIPFGLFSYPIFLLSLPFLFLTIYHMVSALAKKKKYGLFIPVLDVLMGFGFLAGLVESFFVKTRGRD